MTTNLKLTRAQRNLLRIQTDEERTLQAIEAAVIAVRVGYEFVWQLPDEELQELLQELYDTPTEAPFGNELNRLLHRHYTAATSLNGILGSAGREGVRAADTAPRAWNITDGRIELIPLPQPDPQTETTDEPHP